MENKDGKFTSVADVLKEKVSELLEEIEEATQGVLEDINALKSAEGTGEKVIEEVADIISVNYGLFHNLDDEKKFKEVIKNKLNKWYNKFNSNWVK